MHVLKSDRVCHGFCRRLLWGRVGVLCLQVSQVGAALSFSSGALWESGKVGLFRGCGVILHYSVLVPKAMSVDMICHRSYLFFVGRLTY